MNQGRIWCVVHPTVGLPLLLGSVALTSLAVHTAVMTHTTWMSNYWMGAARVRVSDNAATSQNAFSMTVSPAPVAGGPAPAAFVITVAPAPGGTTALAASEPQAPKPGAVPIHTASAN